MPVYNCNTLLGEGPVWDSSEQALYFTDITGQHVWRYSPAVHVCTSFRTSRPVSLVIPADDGRLLLGLQGSLTLTDKRFRSMENILAVEPHIPLNRCNDGKCDAAGRLWFGTMHIHALPHQGALYCYDGSLHKKLDSISISNGLCWSADHTAMYYIDTHERTIRAYDFNMETAAISHPRVVARTVEYPDGMCMDREGMLWVAMWGGGCVNRYHPQTGELTGSVRVNAPHVTSCAFGGPEMDTLYITTARKDLTAAQLAAYPDSGALFAVKLPVRGLPAHTFSIPAWKQPHTRF